MLEDKTPSYIWLEEGAAFSALERVAAELGIAVDEEDSNKASDADEAAKSSEAETENCREPSAIRQ